MARVDLKKTVYERSQFDRVVGSREFQTFTQPTVEEDVTVEEFFNLYEELYLTIPINGDTQSHEYLVRKSTELTGIRDTTEDIQPLLDEIANLRQQLLEARQDNILSQIQNVGAGTDISSKVKEILDEINSTGVDYDELSNTPSPNTNI